MTHLNTKNGWEYWGEDVPKGTSGFECSVQGDGIPCYTYWYGENLDPDVVCLPPGKWEILGRLNDISEEVAAGLVEKSPLPGYVDYWGDFVLLKEATKSLKSFFRSNGVEGNPIVLIQKK